MSDSLRPHGLYSPWSFLGQNTGVGSLSLLQGMFPTQGSNPGLLHCRWILYQLSPKRSPRILEWAAYPFPSGSSRPRNQMGLLHCRWILYQLHYQESPSQLKCHLLWGVSSLTPWPDSPKSELGSLSLCSHNILNLLLCSTCKTTEISL